MNSTLTNPAAAAQFAASTPPDAHITNLFDVYKHINGFGVDDTIAFYQTCCAVSMQIRNEGRQKLTTDTSKSDHVKQMRLAAVARMKHLCLQSERQHRDTLRQIFQAAVQSNADGIDRQKDSESLN